MREIPLEEAPGQVTDAAHDAARGQVVYLTEHGERLAAIVPAELAAELEGLTPEQLRELLEDFADTRAVLAEWLRVLKPGGRLILYLPDEQVYRRHCASTNQPYNTHHQHADFSLEFVRNHLAALGGTRVLHENPQVEIYSWEIVAEKLAPS